MVSCGADIHCNCFPGDEAGGREEFERREGGKSKVGRELQLLSGVWREQAHVALLYL